jgi:tRNA (mo5U34)-methyltransferase
MKELASPPIAVSRELIAAKIRAINWFHRIDLGQGIITPGDDDSPKKLAQLCLPRTLQGKTFLDIGAWDGFFSFEAERRGASRVLATDSFVWRGNVPGKSKEGFLTARSVLGSRVEDLEIDAMDISPERIGRWDVVLFAGVLYHMIHPVLALEHAASVTRELLIVETATDLEFVRRPAIAFYPGAELGRDVTNWSGANTKALKAMLHSCGFQEVTVMYRKPFLRRLLSAGKRLSQESPWAALQQSRVVVHARRTSHPNRLPDGIA